MFSSFRAVVSVLFMFIITLFCHSCIALFFRLVFLDAPDKTTRIPIHFENLSRISFMNFIDLIPFDLDIGWNCQTILNKFIATLTAIDNHLCALHQDLIIHFFFFSASTRLGLVRLNEKWILFIIWIFFVSFPGTKKNLNAFHWEELNQKTSLTI